MDINLVPDTQYPASHVDNPANTLYLGPLGSSLGKAIGTIIANGSDVKAVALGSVTEALGHDLAVALADGSSSTLSFAEKASNGISHFTTELAANVINNAVGAAGAVMLGELLDAAGLDRFSSGLLETTVDYALVTPTVGAGLVELGLIDATGKITGDIGINIDNLFSGDKGNFSVTGLVDVLGNFAGAFLAHSLVHPENVGGSIGSQIGSILGSFIPFPVPGVGTFFGTIMGTVIGDLFGHDSVGPNSGATLDFDAGSAHYYVAAYDQDNGGNAEAANNMGKIAAAALNDVLDAAGGTVGPGIGGLYGIMREHFYSDRDFDEGVRFYGDNAEEAIVEGVLRTLRETTIVGSDETVLKMISHTAATTLEELYSDLAVAKDYRLYLAHQGEIESAIMAAPDSSFALGWALTLARADELQLDEPLGAWPPPAPQHLTGTDLDDQMQAGTGNDRLSGEAGNDNLFGGDGNDRVLGGGGGDTLHGEAGYDTLTGGDGNDWLDGGANGDLLDGGAGTDHATYSSAGGAVAVDLGAGHGTAGDAAGDHYVSVEDVIGSNYGDTIAGDGGNNWLAGLGGNDTLLGEGGSDTLQGGADQDYLNGGDGNDTLYGDDGFDTLVGGNGDDRLEGGNHNDTLYGDGGNDTLLGGADQDYLIGGDGNDTLFGEDGFDTLVGGWGDDWLAGGGHNDTLSGEEGNDTIFAGWGEDYLAGGAGNDSMYGEDGYDLLDGGSGDDNMFGGGHNDTLYGGDGGDTLSGDWGDDHLLGQDGNDTLYGNEDNDWLTGGAGADWLDGGAGGDNVNYADSWGAVGVDLEAGVGWSAEAEGDRYVSIEGVQGSHYNDDLRGDGNGNWLNGESGDDWLFGRGGADVLDGGAGFDVANYVDSWAGVTIDLRSGMGYGGSAEGDHLYNIEGVHGSLGDDHLHGNDGVNWLYGSQGNDWLHGYGDADSLYGDVGNDSLNGGWGADRLDGGDGIDWAAYMWATTGVGMTLEGNYGWLGEAAGDTFYSIENVLGSEYGDELHGDWRSNWLVGAGGSDKLMGHGGNDTLSGGWGEDYLDGGEGNDTVMGEDGYDTLIGGNGNDYLDGGGHNDTLAGDDGDDTLIGGWGEDYLIGGGNNDVLAGGDGYDTLVGGWGDDYLMGDGHDDALFGEDGNDTLVGGWGNDNLIGGTGNDTMIGEAGDDGLDGGDGYDSAVYDGSRSGYYVYFESYGHGAIIDTNGADGGDTGGDWVWNTERILFRDAAVYFDGSQGWPPLVIDLDGDGIELTDVFDSTVEFDMTGDGIADRTAWAAADDGLIVYDMNGDRRITEQQEVVLATHGQEGMTDLEALAYGFDDNRDGWFDAADAHWQDFGVWRDRNQDGVTDEGEYRTLEEAGIARIGLTGNGMVEVVAGNVINGLAVFETVDGREGMIGDVTLFAKSGAGDDLPVVVANDEAGVPDLDNALHDLAAAMARFDVPTEVPVIEIPMVVDEVVYPVDDTLRQAA